MASLAATFVVRDPSTGRTTAFAKGTDQSDVPDWAVAQITNPKAWDDGVARGEVGAAPSIPKSAVSQHQFAVEEDAGGGGDREGPPSKTASKTAWVNYAASQGADVAELEQLTRDEIADRFGT